ncbi:SMI1/KNR4 family protein [Actinomadura oligospora]|uniref:SMI1/KNR4 family protein n=1 Tax=Actinomadura oligospora TaxID=111804 RepID=UPI001473BB0B|nr:SMI1/KNR4 family protein [Actinomadura oligospora]
MEPTVDRSWDRILAWLAEHAPATLDQIAAPASDDDIAAARAAVGVDLPADLVAWWRRANGSNPDAWGRECRLLPSFGPCGIEHALHSRRIWWQVWHDQGIENGWLTEEDFTWAQAQPAGTHAGMWLRGFLPIAASSGGLDLIVDLRSGSEHGCVREFDRVFTDGKPRWASVASMLADIAGALENQGPIDGLRPYPTDKGTLEWD